ncbi:MAG: hypothetical protein QM775_26885 [Pirellulales bacterium]
MATQLRRRFWLPIAIIIFLVFVGDLVTMCAIAHLVAGWTRFIRLTLSQATPDPKALFTGVAATVLFMLLMQSFCSWLYKHVRSTENTAWRWRWTFCLTTLVLAAFVAGISAIGVVHQTSWLVLSLRD